LKFTSFCLLAGLLISAFSPGTFKLEPQVALAYNANNLISDGEFTDTRTLDADGIQAFLNTKGGTRLRTFREGGKTAAQIIYNAARANGINPFVILATIQKEESLIESNTNFDYRVRWAMGYGVCDGCDSNDPSLQHYAGFTNQITGGTWQLKRNYSYWATASSYRVGSTVVIDDTNVHIDNRATSALYRYTPHLHGNESFVNIYNRYKNYRPPATYDAKLISQVPRANFTVRPGQRIMMLAVYRNTGTATWYKTGGNAMHLGNWGPQDRGSIFTSGANVRWEMLQSAVGRNGVGTFRIYFTAPQQTGVYVEKFRPVMEGINWMGNEVTYTFNVTGSGVSSGTKSKIQDGSSVALPTPTPVDKKSLESL